MLPNGIVLKDNSPGRRVVGFRTSAAADGRHWSCAPSAFTGGNPQCPETFDKDSPAVRPDPRLDPPELQYYRFR